MRERLRQLARDHGVEIAAVLVAIVASWVRLRGSDHFLFGGDSGKMFSLATQLNADGRIATAGIASSKGVVNPPLSIWILQAFEPLSQGVLWTTVLTALSHIAAIVLAFVIVRKYFERHLALLTMILFATAPFAVYYSRFLWQQNWIPLVSTAMLGALLAWVVDERPWMLFVSVVCASIILQLHFSGVCAFAVIGAVAVLQRPRVRRAPVLASIGFTSLLFAPFAWHLWNHSGGGARGGTLFREFFISSLVASAETLSTWGIIDHYRVQPDVFFGWLHPVAGMGLVWLVGLVAVISGATGLFMLVRGGFRRLRRRGLLPWLDDGTVQGVVVDAVPTAQTRARDTVLLFLLVPMLTYFVLGIHTHRHYVILLYPAIWIVAAWPLTHARVRPVFAYIGVVTVALLQLGVAVRMQDVIAQGKVPGAGITWSEQTRAAQWVCENARATPRMTSPVSANLAYLIDRCTRDYVFDDTSPFLVVDETQLPLSDAAKKSLEQTPHYQGVGVWIAQYPGQ